MIPSLLAILAGFLSGSRHLPTLAFLLGSLLVPGLQRLWLWPKFYLVVLLTPFNPQLRIQSDSGTSLSQSLIGNAVRWPCQRALRVHFTKFAMARSACCFHSCRALRGRACSSEGIRIPYQEALLSVAMLSRRPSEAGLSRVPSIPNASSINCSLGIISLSLLEGYVSGIWPICQAIIRLHPTLSV